MTRRTTLAPIDNAPPPRLSMAMGGNRMSFAKPPQRLSMAAPFAGPPPASSRLSMAAPFAGPPPASSRLSMAGPFPGAAAMANPNRRSYNFAPSRPSDIGGRPRDPRNIRDKAFQHNAIRTLIKFLTEAGFPYPISTKILTAPSVKDFSNIFWFLYHQVDPSYVVDGRLKVEDEVPQLARGLGYPFYNEISKSALLAVGSPHAWPVLLALLTWMVELILAIDLDSIQEEVIVGGGGEKLFFQYLSKAYSQWLEGNDSFELLASDLAENFEKKNKTLTTDIEAFERSNREVVAKIEQLDAEQPPLVVMQTRKQQLASDITKFEQLNALLGDKIAKKMTTNLQFQASIVDLEAEVARLGHVRAQYEQQILAQPMTVAEAQKLQLENSRLQASLQDTAAAKTKAESAMWELEMAVAKRLQMLDAVTKRFNSLRDKLNMTLATPTSVEQARAVVKPAVVKFSEDSATTAFKLEASLIALNDHLSDISDTVEQQNANIRDKQAALEALEKQAQTEKRLMARTADLQAELSKAIQDAADQKAQFSNQVLSALDLLVQYKTRFETTLSELQQEIQATK